MGSLMHDKAQQDSLVSQKAINRSLQTIKSLPNPIFKPNTIMPSQFIHLRPSSQLHEKNHRSTSPPVPQQPRQSPALKGIREVLRDRKISQQFESGQMVGYRVDLPRDYWTFPPYYILEQFSEQQLRSVHDFSVGNQHGQVMFHWPVDLASIPSLKAAISISNSNIAIHPDDNPGPGCGLNVPFTMTFFDFGRLDNPGFHQEMCFRRKLKAWLNHNELVIVRDYMVEDGRLVVYGEKLK